jgi:hypothetical protein
VLVLSFASLVLIGTGPEALGVRLAASGMLMATLLVALWTSRSTEGRFIEAVVAIVLASVAIAVGLLVGGKTAKGVSHIVAAMLALLVVVVIAAGVVRSVRERRAVTLQAVFGAVTIYLMFGMFFAFLGAGFGDTGHTAFFTNGTSGSLQDHVYFSFVTITTVGYGDFAPFSDAARTTSIVEALVGQLYLVTVVAIVAGNLGRGPGSRLSGANRTD